MKDIPIDFRAVYEADIDWHLNRSYFNFGIDGSPINRLTDEIRRVGPEYAKKWHSAALRSSWHWLRHAIDPLRTRATGESTTGEDCALCDVSSDVNYWVVKNPGKFKIDPNDSTGRVENALVNGCMVCPLFQWHVKCGDTQSRWRKVGDSMLGTALYKLQIYAGQPDRLLSAYTHAGNNDANLQECLYLFKQAALSLASQLRLLSVAIEIATTRAGF